MWLSKLILFFAATSHQENIHLSDIDKDSVVIINGNKYSDIKDRTYKTFIVNGCELYFEESCENTRCSGSFRRVCSGVRKAKMTWYPCSKSTIRPGFELNIKFFVSKSAILLSSNR